MRAADRLRGHQAGTNVHTRNTVASSARRRDHRRLSDVGWVISGEQTRVIFREQRSYDRHDLLGNALTLRAILGREPRTLRAYFEELAGTKPASRSTHEGKASS